MTAEDMARSRFALGLPAEISDYAPVLRWLLVNCVVLVAVGALWYFGLLQTMLQTDRTRISMLILAVFVITAFHCLLQTSRVATEIVAARKVRARIIADGPEGLHISGNRVLTGTGHALEAGAMTDHIANLLRKAGVQGSAKFDQTVLLRALADRLRARERIGLFVSEGLLRLALLGTAIGFILMLIPIAQITTFEAEQLRPALTGMTGGMAIALNVTVSGIATALVLKFQYYLLDGAIGDLFDLITDTSEVYVMSALERRPDARP